jgi:monoamine oxidase
MMQDTSTRMAGHTKAVLVYEQAFWHQQGDYGNAISAYPSAMLAEVYSACSESAETPALFGFFGLTSEIRDQYRDSLPGLVARSSSCSVRLPQIR